MYVVFGDRCRGIVENRMKDIKKKDQGVEVEAGSDLIIKLSRKGVRKNDEEGIKDEKIEKIENPK